MSSDLEIIEEIQEIIDLSDDSGTEIFVNYDAEEQHKDEICILVKDELENEAANVASFNDNNILQVNRSYSLTKKKTRKRKRLRRKSKAVNRNKNAICGNGQFQKVLKSSVMNESSSVIERSQLLNVTMIENVSICQDNNNNQQLNIEEPLIDLTNLQEPNEHLIIEYTNDIPKKQNQDYSKLKWLKPLHNLSSPSHLQIVIIDRNHEDWRITTDKWFMIEKRLLETLNNEMLRTNDTSIGQFDGAKWQRGIKVIGCHNENAFNFITKFILNLDKLWHGANLDVFPISQINRHIVKAFIPPPVLKTEFMLSLIKLQNPKLYCEDWIVVRESERTNNDGGVDIWLSVNVESFKLISSLRGEIKYGINRIFLNPSYNF